MTVTQRIEKVLKIKKIGQKELGDLADVHKNTVSAMINKQTDPSFKIVSAILKSFRDINPYWLILGEGEMLIEEKELLSFEKLTTLDSDMKTIKLVLKEIINHLGYDDLDGILDK